MAAYGPQALSTAELLALLLRSGTAQESVIRLAERLLSDYRSLKGIAMATVAEPTRRTSIRPCLARLDA